MRLLFLGVSIPSPANNGQKMRSLSLLRALANHGNDIAFIGLAQPTDELSELAPLREICRRVNIVRVPMTNLSARTDVLNRLLSIAATEPHSIRRFRCAVAEEQIATEMTAGQFDAIVVDGVYPMVNLRRGYGPIILNAHNVEHVILDRYAALESNLFKSLYARMEAAKMKKCERCAVARTPLTLACSENDRLSLLALSPEAQIAVVPNTVEVGVPNTVTGEPLTLVYQGGMDWYPNRDAVEYFIKSILPLVRAKFPQVRLVVGGRNPSPGFLARYAGHPGIEFTGTVADMQRVIARAAVCIVPLRIGSGTRLKILEAAAMGKAVVSTTIGAEGLEFEGGKHLLIADRPDHFARAIEALLGNDEWRIAMGRRARDVVAAKYSEKAMHVAVGHALEMFSERIGQLAAIAGGY